MTLNRRERIFAISTVSILLLFALDRFLFTPYQERRASLQVEKSRVLAEIQQGRSVIARWRVISAEHGDNGVPGSAGAVVTLNALRDWAEESRLTLTLLRPEATTRHEQWEETVFQVVAAGPMKSVSGFLWRVENSGLPLKIKNLQLSARREGSDDLALQVRVGSLAPNARAASDPSSAGKERP